MSRSSRVWSETERLSAGDECRERGWHWQTAGCTSESKAKYTLETKRMMKVAPLALLLGSAHANTVKNMNGTLHLRTAPPGGRGGRGGEGERVPVGHATELSTPGH